MKIFKQLTVILAFSAAGVLISTALSLAGFNFPGSIIGMALLFIGLMTTLIKPHLVGESGKFLISNMGIFFVPALVALLNNLSDIAPIWWKLLLIILISFALTYVAVLLSVNLTIKLQERAKNKKSIHVPAENDDTSPVNEEEKIDA